MNVRGVIDDATLEQMRAVADAERMLLVLSMGRKHLMHPANRVKKEPVKPLLSQYNIVEDKTLPNDICKIVQPNHPPVFFRIK